MATKDQAREALQQIKAPVAGLGPNSYIATAFRGMFDIAEENIENDFSGNLMEQAQNLGEPLAQHTVQAASWPKSGTNTRPGPRRQKPSWLF